MPIPSLSFVLNLQNTFHQGISSEFLLLLLKIITLIVWYLEYDDGGKKSEYKLQARA